MSIKYLNPQADCLVPAQPYRLKVDIGGPLTVGLVINRIVDCDRFMGVVGDVLKSNYPHFRVREYLTGTITWADSELIDRVAVECDLAICAIGHCGSCTAGTVKDGIHLIEKGCASVALVTDLFWEQAGMLARSLVWPDAPPARLP